MESSGKRLVLPDEDPEILSSILEYLYKGDYSPRLVHNKRRDAWEIESNDAATVTLHGIKGEVLKDTVIYCVGEKYGLEELKRIALRKQGLRKSQKDFHNPHESLHSYTLVDRVVFFLVFSFPL